MGRDERREKRGIRKRKNKIEKSYQARKPPILGPQGRKVTCFLQSRPRTKKNDCGVRSPDHLKRRWGPPPLSHNTRLKLKIVKTKRTLPPNKKYPKMTQKNDPNTTARARARARGARPPPGSNPLFLAFARKTCVNGV